jgi:hypothetical protein
VEFTYFAGGDSVTPSTSNEENIDRVRVDLTVEVPGDPPRTQTLITDIALRNRSNDE